jgi:hypothetical protein
MWILAVRRSTIQRVSHFIEISDRISRKTSGLVVNNEIQFYWTTDFKATE